MINNEELKIIKEIIEEFLEKMTITSFNIELTLPPAKPNKDRENLVEDVVGLNIKVEEPQILIGQNGQTLFELQRILRIILNKKLSRFRQGSSMPIMSSIHDTIGMESGSKNFYLNLDINDYKKKKIEYLKTLANEAANEASLTKEKKILPPMPAYERKIIHEELANRQDVATESQGDGIERSVVIKLKI